MGVPISNVTRRVVYAASGTGPYNFTFEILAATDVAVYRDDTLLTLTTNYTVTINANGTGFITLTAAPTGATQIAIVGNRTIQRMTDFVTGGDFFANTVNDEMDQQTIFAQQNAESIERSLKAPQTDPTNINMTLPRKVDRSGKYLGFDVDGNPVALDGTAESPGLGTMATQNASNVAISGGTIAGIVDLAVADGGTGSSTASGARSNLGLGTISTQNADAVAITGGTVDNVVLGGTSTVAASALTGQVAVANGGTGASTAANARTNLGLTIGTDVQAASNVLTTYASTGVGFRNRIINGDMRIDQRNAGASVTLTAAVGYPVDRFIVTATTTTLTVQQGTAAPAGFTNSLQVTNGTGASPSAAQFNGFAQNIEGFNVSDLGWGAAGAQTVTLSFWVRSSVTGTYAGRLGNVGDNRVYVFTYTIVAANTWEFKTITIVGDTTGTWNTNNTRGIQLLFDLGSGSNFNGTAGSWGTSNSTRTSGSVNWTATSSATFNITGVQLEAGSVATPFERRDYGRELMMCQRYFQRITLSGISLAAFGSWYLNRSFFVPMRAAPTITWTGSWSTTNPTPTQITSNTFYWESGTGQFYSGSSAIELISAEL
jgi:hypothetical protein